ncbi:MAG: heavy-metal-associated domain-containing protein [Bacteroidales bacterium]|nr:heavy-metal-associated domain-containing protein [Bacteroidales bacterium]
MKKNILILVLALLLGIGNVFAQEQKAAKQDTKISEVILSTEMHCQNCADKVAKQLAYTKGVIDVQANHEKNAVYIKYRNDRTDTEKLIASLKEIGYTATVYNAGHQCPHAKNGAGCGNHAGCNHSQEAQKTSGCGNHEHHEGCNHNHDAQKK